MFAVWVQEIKATFPSKFDDSLTFSVLVSFLNPIKETQHPL